MDKYNIIVKYLFIELNIQHLFAVHGRADCYNIIPLTRFKSKTVVTGKIIQVFLQSTAWLISEPQVVVAVTQKGFMSEWG